MQIFKDKIVGKLFVFSVIVVFFYLFLSVKFDLFFIPKAKIDDFYTRLSPKLRPPPPSLEEMVILEIDSESIHYSNARWPWRRGIVAQLLTRLKGFSPRVVLLDFFLSGKTEAIDDLQLQEALKGSGNILIASYISESGHYMRPHPMFAESALGYGCINKPRDKDLFIRRSRMVVLSRENEVLDYSLAIEGFCVVKGAALESISYDGEKKTIVVPYGEETLLIPLHEDRTLDINYRYSARDFEFIPVWKVFRDDLPPDRLRDKIVFIGATTEVTHETYSTPLGILPGVVINAYELITLLENAFISRFPLQYEFLILLLLTAIVSFFTYRFSFSKGLGFFLIAVASYFLFSLMMTIRDIRVDGFGPPFLCLLSYVSVNFYQQISFRRQITRLQQLATTDSLTGVYVRRYFDLRLQYERDCALRYKSTFSLLILDIDSFKKINDTYGHPCGDFVLKEVANVLKDSCRKTDIICRYGGDEFAIILPQTEKPGAMVSAERIRKNVVEVPFRYKDEGLKVTVSIGEATFNEISPQDPPEALISVADARLYKKKKEAGIV